MKLSMKSAGVFILHPVIQYSHPNITGTRAGWKS
jgi:hypothetical protein